MSSVKDQRIALGLSELDVSLALEMTRPTYHSRETGSSPFTIKEALKLKELGINAFPPQAAITPPERLKIQTQSIDWLIRRCEEQMVRGWLISERDLLKRCGGLPEYEEEQS